MLTAQTCFMVARSLVNPEVYRSVGIDPREGRRAALGNPHFRETMQWMGEKPLAFLRENDLLPEEPGAGLAGLAAARVESAARGSDSRVNTLVRWHDGGVVGWVVS